MAEDLIYELSPNELKRRTDKIIECNKWPFPEPTKRFLAIVHLQKFMLSPKVVTRQEMDSHVANGCLELNRGLSATKDLSASFYGGELLHGEYYPGTIISHGHGMYFAEPSLKWDSTWEANSTMSTYSKVADVYARKNGLGGVIMRGALKPKALTKSMEEMNERFHEAKNRARRAGIGDVGTFSAASGIDAFYVDGSFSYTDERVWVVLNRRVLVLQENGLIFARQEGAN